MRAYRSLLASALVVGPLAAPASAQHHHHPSPVPPGVASPAAFGVAGYAAVGGYGAVGGLGAAATNTYIPSYLLGTPGLNYQAAASAHVPGGPGVAFPFFGVSAGGPGQPGPGGLMLPQAGPAGRPISSASAPSPSTASASRAKSGRTDDLLEMGDRSFRGGNYRRAEERYQQAHRVQKDSPDPHVRLAQVAVVRGDYERASAHLRDAVAGASSPGWLSDPRDIQAMFAEPGDFARQLARLESHLQAHPQDRNAWFVLGAEQHLSGRHRQARDAFLRLTGRPADPALAAFLDATTIASRTESTHESASPAAR